MAILRFEAVRREIGSFVILDDVSAAVAHGERIGLVGINGAGKTTLLRLAAGTDTPDGGRVVRKAGLTIGLLSQEANLDAAFASATDRRSAPGQPSSRRTSASWLALRPPALKRWPPRPTRRYATASRHATAMALTSGWRRRSPAWASSRQTFAGPRRACQAVSRRERPWPAY
jgi:energy-coupling factor transporter ATP-binding protein EcfA2